MTFKQMIPLYFITLAVFFVIDMIWLGLVAKGFYRRHLGSFMSPKVNWIAAMLFYLLFIVGLLVFAVRPALVAGIPLNALFYGALLGLISYATYDLTNMATLKDWPHRPYLGHGPGRRCVLCQCPPRPHISQTLSKHIPTMTSA